MVLHELCVPVRKKLLFSSRGLSCQEWLIGVCVSEPERMPCEGSLGHLISTVPRGVRVRERVQGAQLAAPSCLVMSCSGWHYLSIMPDCSGGTAVVWPSVVAVLPVSHIVFSSCPMGWWCWFYAAIHHGWGAAGHIGHKGSMPLATRITNPWLLGG
jgi:hypothetical protein